MSIGWQLALVATLVVLNALFAGSEIALISLREGQLNRLEQRGGTGRLTVRLARDPNRFPASRSASPWRASWHQRPRR